MTFGYSPFDIVILIGALCGLIMVAGSIYLLRIGVVDLKQKVAAANSDEGDALSIAMNELKVSTRYPALGLFVVGLCFVFGSAYLSKTDVLEIPIEGTVTASDNSDLSSVQLEIMLVSRKFPVDQHGIARHTLFYSEKPSNLVAHLIAPGYPDNDRTVPLTQARDGSWSLEISLSAPVAEKPPTGDLRIQ